MSFATIRSEANLTCQNAQLTGTNRRVSSQKVMVRNSGIQHTNHWNMSTKFTFQNCNYHLWKYSFFTEHALVHLMCDLYLTNDLWLERNNVYYAVHKTPWIRFLTCDSGILAIHAIAIASCVADIIFAVRIALKLDHCVDFWLTSFSFQGL